MEEGVRIVSVNLGDLWSGAAGTGLVALFTVGYTEAREAQGAPQRGARAREQLGELGGPFILGLP